MNVIKSSANMKSSPDDETFLETECLFGETVEILDKYKTWIYCRLMTDDYKGWVKEENLGFLKSPTHRVIVKRTFIYADKDPKSNCFLYLSMGSKLTIKKMFSNWAEVFLSWNNYLITGYVPTNHVVNLNHKMKDWVSKAEQLIETPYKWGGRDTIGLDCSALLQIAYETFGETIPRNTIDQVNIMKKEVKDLSLLKRGFVIFWKGHVGIMTDNLNCIHANAYHMKTVVEPLSKIIERMGNQNRIIKILNFN